MPQTPAPRRRIRSLVARAAWLDDPVLALHGRSALAAERAAEAVRAACES